MQAMLSGIYGLTVNWTAVTLGPGRSLASHADYQAFLKASTQDQDSNPNLMARVDVKAPDAPPRRRGPAVGSVRSRPPLAPLDSLLNAIGTTALGALPGFHTLADSVAKLLKMWNIIFNFLYVNQRNNIFFTKNSGS